jgi:hypothetical protein
LVELKIEVANKVTELAAVTYPSDPSAAAAVAYLSFKNLKS